MGNKSRLYFAMLFFSLFAIYFLIVNIYAPEFADDYVNSYIRGTSYRMTTFADIIKNTYLVYIGWTGRFTSSFLMYLSIYAGDMFFNVVNTIVIILFFFLVSLYINSKEVKFDNIILIVFLFWFGLPVIGETVFWTTGSIVYLWTTVICLLFMLPYRYLFGEQSTPLDKYPKFSALLMAFMGFITGGTVENFVPVSFLAIVLFYLYLRTKKKMIPGWFYSGFLGLFVGFPFLVLSPGNSIRAKVEGVENFNRFDISRIYYFFTSVLKDIYLHQFILVIFFLVLVVLLFVMKILRKDKSSFINEKQVLLAALFFIMSVLMQVIMIMSPYFPLRTSFIGAVFHLIAIVILYNYIKQIINNRVVNIILSVGLLIPLTFSLNIVLVQYKTLHQQTNERMQIVSQSVENNIKDVILPKYSVVEHPTFDQGSRHVFIRDITEDTKNWTNEVFSKYFNLNSVRTVQSQALETEIDFKKSISIYSSDFEFNKSFILKDIRYFREGSTLTFYFQFDPKTNTEIFSNKVLYFHAYLTESDLEKYKGKEDVQYGFINWDIVPDVIRTPNNLILVKKTVNTDLDHFPKISIGIYDYKNGNEGQSLEVTDITLKEF
ncbi:DUF6056 family protein [Paenibacillus validus]|uniref:DUF3329 domain-containing protein n=1 Tax=Paenibacillus TaxID=44249 RepID=UPI000FD76E2B|nr:DUF6056 family protein [Paenibacillus validus]MED4599480.1 DUF6056 family protein [Paenibacillus validus]MED4606724.1 DUF6056 family protein [Paenibacillus validus]